MPFYARKSSYLLYIWVAGSAKRLKIGEKSGFITGSFCPINERDDVVRGFYNKNGFIIMNRTLNEVINDQKLSLNSIYNKWKLNNANYSISFILDYLPKWLLEIM